MVTIKRQREIARKAREYTNAIRGRMEDLTMDLTGEIATELSDETQANEDWDACFNEFLKVIIAETTELFRPVVKERR